MKQISPLISWKNSLELLYGKQRKALSLIFVSRIVAFYKVFFIGFIGLFVALKALLFLHFPLELALGLMLVVQVFFNRPSVLKKDIYYLLWGFRFTLYLLGVLVMVKIIVSGISIIPKSKILSLVLILLGIGRGSAVIFSPVIVYWLLFIFDSKSERFISESFISTFRKALYIFFYTYPLCIVSYGILTVIVEKTDLWITIALFVPIYIIWLTILYIMQTYKYFQVYYEDA
ncbi:MAG TPA: hypothetical protein VHA52_08340 [Candidatus Babeliaceae bacterium]|nr:hypothetical protein [Candidatus Babeliaceae bacterium]